MLRRTALMTVLIALVLAHAPISRAEWTGLAADQIISFNDSEYARAVQIRLDDINESYLHIFWCEDAPSVRELHYGKSSDAGDTWSSTSADRVISYQDGNDVYDECDATIHYPLGHVVVWSEVHGTWREVHYGISTDDGTTWSCTAGDQILSFESSDGATGVPSIARDLSGVLHVVWHQPTPGGEAEVHYGRSTDNGVTWSSQSADRVISFPDGEAALDPKIIDSAGKLYVAWREKDAAGEPRVHIAISDDGGDTWSSETADREISGPATFITDLAIAAQPWDHYLGVVIVYQASFDTSSPYHYEIYSTFSYDEGVTWSGETVLTPVSHDEGAGRSASNPDVFTGETGGTWAVWDEEEDSAGTKEQHISWFGGQSWDGAEADAIISFPDGENGYRPSITGTNSVIDRHGNGRTSPMAFVAWTEFAGTTPDNYEVHLSTLPGWGGAVDDAPEPLPTWVRVAPSVSLDHTHLAFALEIGGSVRVAIFDPEGRRVRELGGELSAGAGRLIWDGTNEGGRPVPPGRYVARVRGPEGVVSLPIVRF